MGIIGGTEQTITPPKTVEGVRCCDAMQKRNILTSNANGHRTQLEVLKSLNRKQ